MKTQEDRTGPVLVVGYDGSRTSRDALAHAASRAGESGTVVVSHTFGPGPAWFGAPSYHPASDDYEARGRALIADFDPPPGVRVELDLNEGSPAAELLRVAADWDADEIVIGSRGFFPVHTGLGSVSLALMKIADRPVTIIPARATRRSHEPGVTAAHEPLVHARS
jgi:nucleotide-binding universal stress UspA family protein